MAKMNKLSNNYSFAVPINQELSYHSKSCKSIFSKKDAKKNSSYKNAISSLLKSISINSYRCGKPYKSITQKESSLLPTKGQIKLNQKSPFPKLFSPITKSCLSCVNYGKGININYNNSDIINQCKQTQCLPTLLNKTKPLTNKSNKPKLYFSYTQSGGKHNKLKQNQDAYMEKDYVNNVSCYSFYGVFDGHGKQGSIISQSVAVFFKNYYSLPEFTGNAVTPAEISKELIKNDFEKIKESHIKAETMLKDNQIDGSLSGTSATCLFFIDDILICSNVGDSRAIAITSSNTIIPLSFDHKPDKITEAERIIRLKGRVERFKGDTSGPLRIWLKDEDYPGLSMSRSIGDFIAEEIGVINEPEVIRYSIKDIDPNIILCATDGIWELLSNDDIIAIITPFYLSNDAEEAAKKLAEEAKKKWQKMNNGFVDDITLIVLFF